VTLQGWQSSGGPQWGRLSSSRITLASEDDHVHRHGAAMGPALIEPDHTLKEKGLSVPVF